ncbi:uncharacterized protein PGTG_21478 [Puccinia graminis f. sp. tritici CRL 75-36-700-3]|uniref:Uncharacterized protein n=1 Tax=Puccinia graminis f. sp. tritici (strain CRL 75-36-700-3 / race SCCL) TaxID=418459 RepID=H6QRT1_PUCGT|nr:uncharacterized protein PGTG_21478 [Puccinia graminis f. sp. tritici CRL 75-36-700-3]EHS63404.1 hypothetical protein PGTG_21478 [Puccinia graminis f. sp. tritici CRL 75-36-700-3]
MTMIRGARWESPQCNGVRFAGVSNAVRSSCFEGEIERPDIMTWSHGLRKPRAGRNMQVRVDNAERRRKFFNVKNFDFALA